MSVPKSEFVSTRDASAQGPHEPSTQAIWDLAEQTCSEDQRVLLAALDTLEKSDTDVPVHVPARWEETFQRIHRIPPEQHDERMRRISLIRDALHSNPDAAPSGLSGSPLDTLSGQMLFDLISTLTPLSRISLEQTSRAMRAAVEACRAQLVASFLNEPGLEKLLSYFCPQSLGNDQPGAFRSLEHDLLTKVVPDILRVLRSSANISDDEMKVLCNHSPDAIVGNLSLLSQTLQAAYDDSLVSIVVRGVQDPPAPLPDLQAVPTLKEKARSTREWLAAHGSSVERIILEDGVYATCLPEEVCALTNLSYLSLKDQRIRTLPHSIGNLCSLRDLDLSYNLLTTLPSEIGNLGSLRMLLLGHNRLTDLPQSIGTLGLTDLYLNGNRLTALPSEIGNLTCLDVLSLENNQLTTLPSVIGGLTSLTRLFLTDNQLKAFASRNRNPRQPRGTPPREKPARGLASRNRNPRQPRQPRHRKQPDHRRAFRNQKPWPLVFHFRKQPVHQCVLAAHLESQRNSRPFDYGAGLSCPFSRRSLRDPR